MGRERIVFALESEQHAGKTQTWRLPRSPPITRAASPTFATCHWLVTPGATRTAAARHSERITTNGQSPPIGATAERPWRPCAGQHPPPAASAVPRAMLASLPAHPRRRFHAIARATRVDSRSGGAHAFAEVVPTQVRARYQLRAGSDSLSLSPDVLRGRCHRLCVRDGETLRRVVTPLERRFVTSQGSAHADPRGSRAPLPGRGHKTGSVTCWTAARRRSTNVRSELVSRSWRPVGWWTCRSSRAARWGRRFIIARSGGGETVW